MKRSVVSQQHRLIFACQIKRTIMAVANLDMLAHYNNLDPFTLFYLGNLTYCTNYNCAVCTPNDAQELQGSEGIHQLRKQYRM